MQIRCDNKNDSSNNKFGGCDIQKQGRKEQDNQEKIVVRIKVYLYQQRIQGVAF